MATLICPICGTHVSYASMDEVAYRPFCSARCQHVDLGRWLSEEYRIVEQHPMDPNAPDPRAPGEGSSESNEIAD